MLVNQLYSTMGKRHNALAQGDPLSMMRAIDQYRDKAQQYIEDIASLERDATNASERQKCRMLRSLLKDAVSVTEDLMDLLKEDGINGAVMMLTVYPSLVKKLNQASKDLLNYAARETGRPSPF